MTACIVHPCMTQVPDDRELCHFHAKVIVADEPVGILKRSRYHSRPLCGAWLPHAKETCARRIGHKDSHRSAWAMKYGRECRRRVVWDAAA